MQTLTKNAHDMQSLKEESPLNVEEAAEFLGISTSHLYKLTSKGQIPHYKPFGKRLYFYQSDLNEIIKSGRVMTDEEIRQEAARKTAGVSK